MFFCFFFFFFLILDECDIHARNTSQSTSDRRRCFLVLPFESLRLRDAAYGTVYDKLARINIRHLEFWPESYFQVRHILLALVALGHHSVDGVGPGSSDQRLQLRRLHSCDTSTRRKKKEKKGKEKQANVKKIPEGETSSWLNKSILFSTWNGSRPLGKQTQVGSEEKKFVEMFHLPSRLWSTSPGRFLWTGAGPVGAIPCLRAPMLRDFLGGPVVPAGSPAANTSGAIVSPFVSWGLLGQANCSRYSVLIREIALLSWLGGKPDCVVTSCNNDFTIVNFRCAAS